MGGENGDKTTSKPLASDGDFSIRRRRFTGGLCRRFTNGEISSPGNASGVWRPDKQCIMDCEYLGLYIVTSVLFIVDQVSRFQFPAMAEFFKGLFPG